MQRLICVLALGVLCGIYARPTTATVLTYQTNMTGSQESPPNGSPATAFAQAVYDTQAHTLAVSVTFSGLTGTTTASHIHANTASAGTGTSGVALPFNNFPTGITSGSYSNTYDLTQTSTYNSGFLSASGGTAAGAEAALTNGFANGTTYWNIHTTTFGGGEIRGFLTLAPEPGSVTLLTLGAMATLLRRRSTRR